MKEKKEEQGKKTILCLFLVFDAVANTVKTKKESFG